MGKRGRVDGFEGTDVQYISYLEDRLSESRRFLALLHQPHQSVTLPRQSVTIPPHQSITLPPRQSITLPCPPSPLPSPPSSPSPNPTESNVNESVQFITVDPTTALPPSKRVCNENARWRKELNIFISSIPKADAWEKTRKEFGFVSVEQNHLAIDILLKGVGEYTDLRGPSPSSGVDDPVQNRELLQRARAYAYLTKIVQERGAFTKMLGLFQELVLVSLCVVMAHNGVPTDSVDSVMKVCISESSWGTLKKLRLGSLWANRAISTLFKKGWHHISSEIFLLCKWFQFFTSA